MRVFGGALVAATIMSGGAVAQDNRPLPPFEVASSAGALVQSDRLTASARALLVYVTPETVASDRLLRAIDAWTGVDAARIVVIANGPAASIDARIKPQLGASSTSMAVYADPDGRAARALALTSIPALVGIERGAVAWVVQGVLNDPAMVEPVVRNWLVQP